MATSDNHGLPPRRTGSELSLEALTRYDLVLAIIPTVFLVAVLVGQLLSIPTQVALAGAAVLGAFAVCDALFLNPPRETR